MGGSGDASDEIDPKRQRIFLAAAEWYAKAIDNRLTKKDRAAFKAWLDEDPAHAEAYANAERLWTRSGDLPETKARKKKAKLTRRDLGKAVLALGAAGAAWRYLSDHPFADFRTSSGERRQISLPDGSRVDLAPQSRLSVTFDGQVRRLTLHEGEAFFNVAADRRPFTVEAGRGITAALGTAFGVSYRDEAARVVVTEHSVRLTVSDQAAQLAAGSEVHYADRIGPVATVNLEQELGWLDGRLVFNGVPLGDVVAALNVWRRGRLVVMDRALAQRPVTFLVNIDDVADIGYVLERSLPIKLIQITPFLIFIFQA